MSEKPPENQDEESAGDRWLYNGVVFFLFLPSTLYLGWISNSVFGYIVFPGLGVGLTVWRVAVTPEIRNRITFNLNLKGRKQVVKGSPGASVTQAENVYNFPAPAETAQILSNLVPVYTTIRKTVRGWQDLSYAGFSDWSRLDEDDPLSVIQIRRTAPELAALFDRATSLFDKIWLLRGTVTTLIDDEQERLVQKFQPKFNSGSKVKFSFFRVSADGGNENTLYLIHAWIRGQNLREYAEFAARARIPNLKTWNLELMVLGQWAGQPVTESVAAGEEAIEFGHRVLDYLETQEPARRLRDKLKKVPELRGEILPLIERELSKG